MKKIGFILFCLSVWQHVHSQVNAGTDTLLCIPAPVTLTAEVTGIMGTTAYTLAPAAWSPEPIAGTSVGLTDDAISPAQPIGFNFCFFGNSYTQFYIGSNGWIGFTAGQPNAFTSQTLPNTGPNVPKNCIMGPWQDWHPGTGNNIGNYIKYQTVGTAPNRKLIVTWDNVPMFSCTNNFGKFQIVLFETSNVIRSNIFNKPTCAWAGGNATQGIHNLTGTVAYTVPGRNSANWTATNETHEYTPNGIVWTQNGTPVGSTASITVSPTQTTTYVATVALCSGIFYSDDVTVTIGSDLDFSPSIVVPTNCSNTVGSISVATSGGGAGPYTYVWEGLENTSSELTDLDDGTYQLTLTDESNGCIYEASFEVPVSSTLSLVTSDNDITCNGANDGQASVIATSNFPGFTYSWSDAFQQTTPEISNLTSGLYSVEVTDADGCTETAIVIISEPSPLNVSFNSTLISCPNGNDGTITAVPSGGVGNYSLLWDNYFVGSTLSNLSEGEYGVTLFDANGCALEGSFTISDPEPIGANFIVNAPSCAGIEDGIVAVQGNGGNAPYTYFWPVANTFGDVLDGLTSGNYTVIITDNNACIDSATVEISPVLELTIAPTLVIPTCFGDTDGSIQVGVSGGIADYTFQWNDPNLQTTSQASGLTAGTYTLLVEDANGCQGVAQITLSQPAILGFVGQLNDASCFNSTNGSILVEPQGGTGPYDIDWTGNYSGFLVENLGAGIYPFELTDNNGCSTSDSIELLEPTALTGTVEIDDAICNQTATGTVQTTVAGGVGPYNYAWSQNSQNVSFNNALSAGPQSVTITDQNGCTLALTFNVGEPAALSVDILTEPASCDQSDGSALATPSGGTAPYTYFWNINPSNNNSFGNLAAGSYTLVLEDNNGCQIAANYVVGEIPVEASFSTNTTEGITPLEVEFINTSQGANSYTWDFGDGSAPAVTSSSAPVYHTYTEEGFFNAILYATYDGACESIDSLDILAFEVSQITKIPNVVSPNSDGENDTFRVLSLNMKSLEATIFDRWGKEVGVLQSPEDEWSPGDQADGVYYYVLTAAGYDKVTYQLEGTITVVR
jgi:gliding motility-associated-like protein